MLPISTAMNSFKKRGINLVVADGALRYSAPRGALSPGDIAFIKANRTQVIDHLVALKITKERRISITVGAAPRPTLMQEMYWRNFSADSRYRVPLNVGVTVAIAGTASGLVEEAIRAVIARHQVLRSRFELAGSELFLAMNEPESLEVISEDLRHLEPAAARASTYGQAASFVSEHIPIIGEGLTRIKLFRLNDDDTVVVFAINHIVMDGTSKSILASELRGEIERRKAGVRRALPPDSSFNDAGVAERRWLDGEAGEVLIGYWQKRYSEMPEMLTPLRHLPMPSEAGIKVIYDFLISGQEIRKLRRYAQQASTSVFFVLLAVFSKALARWSGLDRFPLRIQGDLRTTPELANTIGYMACADVIEVEAPLRVSLSKILHTVQCEYETALALRLPGLHYFPPHCVRPDIFKGTPNKIPAVVNYLRANRADSNSVFPMRGLFNEHLSKMQPGQWPPKFTRREPWTFPFRVSPIFLNWVEEEDRIHAMLHFNEAIVSEQEQRLLISFLFEELAEVAL